MALIEVEADITIAEMPEWLRSEAGIAASVGTIWTFLDRAGLFSAAGEGGGVPQSTWLGSVSPHRSGERHGTRGLNA